MKSSRFPLVFLTIALTAALSPSVHGLERLPADGQGKATDPAVRAAGLAPRIDEQLAAQWTAEDVKPAPPADDAEFLRRASLDLNGVIPRASEVREYLADNRPDKRAQLVERLLASPRYATHMATTWRNRILPTEAEPSRGRQAMALQKWLRTRFAKNLRYDNLVGGLLLTNGSDELGPSLYFQAHDSQPEKMAASAAELFLGVKLHCAQCHDHPYADWKQREFWGFAAFFARTKPADANGMMNNTYRLIDSSEGDVKLPESEEVVPPKYPRGETVADEAGARRSQLVLWLTSRDNEFFSRAAVNWAWSHMFGQPLVQSIDDADGPDASPRALLLNDLADEFVASGFNLQQLWRTLAATRAYQLSSRHDDPQSATPELFARMLPKPLTPEQLFDSFVVLSPTITAATGAPLAAAINASASSLDEDPNRQDFCRRMRPPPGEATEYRAGTLQALMLMNGRTMTGATSPATSSLVGALDAPFMDETDQIEAMFLATLSREPDDGERKLFNEALAECKSPGERTAALSDMFWALLNSTEFAFNH